MGRWAQANRRGCRGIIASTAAIVVLPPSLDDLAFGWDGGEEVHNGQWFGDPIPSYAIGIQMWVSYDGGAYIFGDQSFTVTDLLIGPAGHGGAAVGRGKFRWITSGGGEGDPASTYSDFCAELEADPF